VLAEPAAGSGDGNAAKRRMLSILRVFSEYSQSNFIIDYELIGAPESLGESQSDLSCVGRCRAVERMSRRPNARR
jgi:hypothetical protein